jgi:uncharacterized protein (TIGR04141 family)
MNLNIYLFKPEVTKFSDCLKPQTKNRKYLLINTTTVFNDVEFQIYSIKGEEKKPGWVSFIEGYVPQNEIEELYNRTCSLLILLKVQTIDGSRIFALSHGFGFHVLDKDILEPNFGLNTTLNCIDPKKVKSLNTRSLGVQSIQKREASNLFTALGEFEIERESEILQSISGACTDSLVGTRMSGVDNLKLSTSEKLTLVDIPEKCSIIYNSYKLDTYKSNFEFIDQVKHEKNSDLVNQLDNLLVEALNNREDNLKISVAYPDQIDYERCDNYKFSGLSKPKNREAATVEDITLKSIYDYLGTDQIDIKSIKKKIHIIGIDSLTEHPCTTREPLYSYCIFETELNDKQYILTNKKWYCIEKSYINRVKEDLDKYVNPHTYPTLLSWKKGNDEGSYNLQYKNSPDFLYLDKQNFKGKAYGRSKIEIADFFHEESHKLYFVKKLNRSATMSHLFSQATVSADLFKESKEFKQSFLKELAQKWPNRAAEFSDDYLNNLKFVYAIGSNRVDPIMDTLPVFSKINLLRHLKILNKLNYKAEIAKIVIS